MIFIEGYKMYRVTKRIFSHAQPSLRNSIDLARKAFYWEKKEMAITKLAPNPLEKESSENRDKTRVDPSFSTASFFTGIGVKESEGDIVSMPSLTPIQ